MIGKEDLRQKPLPAVDARRTALDYHHIPVNRSHNLYTEPLVKLQDFGIAEESYYARTDGLNYPYCRKIPKACEALLTRRSVAEKLIQVNDTLRPYGVEVLVIDGYRPVELQRFFWDLFYNKAKAELKNPTDEECTKMAGQFWSDPRKFDRADPSTWPTHATGGAVDLTLCRIASREQVYMGGVYDDVTEVTHTRYYELLPDIGSLSHRLARQHRRLLFWAMVEAGFANYSLEWWHYDYGTQMWVMNRSLLKSSKTESAAWYGPAEVSEDL